MAAIIVKQQRISRIAAPGITTLRVLVDRSLATAGGPGAGTVVTIPVTVETASILLPQITLYETATAADAVTQGAIYTAQLLDLNGLVVSEVPGFGAFTIRIPSAETTWNEIRENNDFQALIQSAVTNRLGLDTSPAIGLSVITVIGGASQAGLDTINLFFGSSANPPGFRHNIATAQMEVSHDGLTWAAIGSGGGSGTVTSVGLSLPGIFSVSGSPVTVAGTLTGTLVNQSANTVFAGPSSGGAATPAFRILVANDYPTMIGDSGAGGTKGAVPAPAAGDAAANKFLKADGVWTVIPSAPVTSVFGRTGAVVAANGDYSFSQISGSVADGQLSANVTLLGNTVTGTGAIARATSPTIVTPTIASFVNANHTHADAAGGGQLNATNIFNAGTVPVARLPLLVGDSGAGGIAGLAPAPAAGDAAANKFLKADGTWAVVGGGVGTVTSVALSLPAIFSVSGSPVTTSGTLTGTLATQTANAIFAGPTSGGAATPTFRALVANDYVTMIGDSGAGGTKGAVPAPAAGDAAANKFLKADGTWSAVSGGGITVGVTTITGGAAGAVPYNNAGVYGESNLSFASNVLTFTRTGIGSVFGLAGIGLEITNTTPAALNAQQFSPALVLTGQGWKSNATAASQPVQWVLQNSPIQGSIAPTGRLSFLYSVNGSAVSEIFRVNSAANVGVDALGHTIGASNGGQLGIGTGGTFNVFLRGPATGILALGAADAAAASVVAQTISVQNVVAGSTNGAGQPFAFRGSLGTSQGVPGRVHIQTGALIAASGTTQQTPVDREIFGASKILTNNTVTTVVNVTVASNTVAGGIVDYTVEVFDGTDLQIETGEFVYQVTNKGGTIANNTITSPTGYPKNVATAGTLTVTWTISNANPALLAINANSSLTPSTGFPRVTYNLRNHTQQAVAIQ